MVRANDGCLALIVAQARDGVIGKDGRLPWDEPEDLAHFKRVTMGHAILMGRKTFESIGRALPGRRNIVLSRDPDFTAEGCEVYADFEAALAAARETDACPFVIGGAGLYELALPRASIVYLTEIDADVEGDTYFPALEDAEWVEDDHRRSADGRLGFRILRRRQAASPAPPPRTSEAPADEGVFGNDPSGV